MVSSRAVHGVHFRKSLVLHSLKKHPLHHQRSRKGEIKLNFMAYLQPVREFKGSLINTEKQTLSVYILQLYLTFDCFISMPGNTYWLTEQLFIKCHFLLVADIMPNRTSIARILALCICIYSKSQLFLTSWDSVPGNNSMSKQYINIYFFLHKDFFTVLFPFFLSFLCFCNHCNHACSTGIRSPVVFLVCCMLSCVALSPAAFFRNTASRSSPWLRNNKL